MVCVTNQWKRTSLQLDFLKRIWQHLDKDHQAIQSDILDILSSKLRSAISKLNDLKKPRGQSTEGQEVGVRRWKFVLVKERLDKVIQDLAKWQQMFDPSWFLIMKVANPFIDEELGKHELGKNESNAAASVNANGFRNAAKQEPRPTQSIFLPEDGLKSALIQDIMYSPAKYVQRAGSDKWLVVDRILCDADADVVLVRRDVRTLAQKLSCGDPHKFGLLQCRGVIQSSKDGSGRTFSFQIVFHTPKEFTGTPDTLRSILASRKSHALTESFGLAKQLARAINYMHTLGFVHKNVRPETILAFKTQDSTLGLLFLVGFEQVRVADGRTLRKGDAAWEKNLYRHPDRQGLRLDKIYTMQHDIYSLGVCLLEVGLWDSFVSYKHDGTATVLGEALGLTSESSEFQTPGLLKDHLVALAKRILPERMGDIYTKIVVSCLTCLDKDNLDFGDPSEFEDADGVLVGVRYIEKVC